MTRKFFFLLTISANARNEQVIGNTVLVSQKKKKYSIRISGMEPSELINSCVFLGYANL
jgi:hypothetical protein